MKNKLISLLIILLLLGCGYAPVLIEKDYPFKIGSIERTGDKKINMIISKNLKKINNNNKMSNKIVYDVVLESETFKSAISSDSKGDPTIFELLIEVNVKIINNGKLLKQTLIDKKVTYNNLDDKFELSRYEDTLIKNLSLNISDVIKNNLSNL